MVHERADGTLEIMAGRRSLPYSAQTTHTSLRTGDVVANKNLGAALELSRAMQAERDRQRLASSRLTLAEPVLATGRAPLPSTPLRTAPQRTAARPWVGCQRTVGRRAGQRHGRVCEGGRSREPIRRRDDVGTDGERGHAAAAATATPDDGEETEGGHELAHRLANTGSFVMRRREERLAEHDVSDANTRERTGDVGEDVDREVPPGKTALAGVREADRGIEMRARHRAEGEDQRNEPSSRRDRVRQQRDRRPRCRRGCPASLECP
jgi:hypothetical protein